jgi:hypothetical protein
MSSHEAVPANADRPFEGAEEVARRLVERFERLDRAAASYESNAQTMDVTIAHLRETTAAVRDLATHTAEVVRITQSIGGPAILRAIETLTHRLDEQRTTAKRQFAWMAIAPLAGVLLGLLLGWLLARG